MLTLYYAPYSRASRIAVLAEDLGITDQLDIVPVSITRRDGSGGVDPRNPHPEGKVPMLVHDGAEIWESTAIALYLTELFPEAGLGRAIGDPERGPLLSWLAWYGDVVEPLMVVTMLGIEHPGLASTFRGLGEMADRLKTALSKGAYLLPGGYSIADLLIASAFQWAPQLTPDDPAVRDWMARCQDRPAQALVAARDAELAKAG